jgi:hypothetical protein
VSPARTTVVGRPLARRHGQIKAAVEVRRAEVRRAKELEQARVREQKAAARAQAEAERQAKIAARKASAAKWKERCAQLRALTADERRAARLAKRREQYRLEHPAVDRSAGKRAYWNRLRTEAAAAGLTLREHAAKHFARKAKP